MNLEDCIINNSLTIRVKPNAKKTQITKIDKGVVFLGVAAQAENNRANIEVIKFFSRLLKANIKIIKGKTSKEKVLRVEW